MRRKTLTLNETLVYKNIELMHAIKGHPGLWIFKVQPTPNMAHFINLMDSDDKITVNLKLIERLNRLHVFATVITNQLEINAFVPKEKGQKPPYPERTYRLQNKLVEMLQDKIEHKDLSREELIRLMSVYFPQYDENSFKFHHMQKVWKWYGIIKIYADLMPLAEASQKDAEQTTSNQ